MKPHIHITFAPHLQRHVVCPAQTLVAQTLAQAIDAACIIAPSMRHYVCDDQGHIRKHVAVFINGVMLTNRAALDTPLHDGDQIHVIQALTGG